MSLATEMNSIAAEIIEKNSASDEEKIARDYVYSLKRIIEEAAHNGKKMIVGGWGVDLYAEKYAICELPEDNIILGKNTAENLNVLFDRNDNPPIMSKERLEKDEQIYSTNSYKSGAYRNYFRDVRASFHRVDIAKVSDIIIDALIAEGFKVAIKDRNVTLSYYPYRDKKNKIHTISVTPIPAHILEFEISWFKSETEEELYRLNLENERKKKEADFQSYLESYRNKARTRAIILGIIILACVCSIVFTPIGIGFKILIGIIAVSLLAGVFPKAESKLREEWKRKIS